MLKKLALLRCERTAKISHLFQSCKHFFKNFAFFEKFVFSKGRNLVHRERNLVRNDSTVLIKNLIFLKCGCKGSDIFGTCKHFINFFQKNLFFGRIKATEKRLLPIYIGTFGWSLFYASFPAMSLKGYSSFGACQNHSSSVVMTCALV